MRIAGETARPGRAVAEDALDPRTGRRRSCLPAATPTMEPACVVIYSSLDLGDLAFRVRDGDRGARDVQKPANAALLRCRRKLAGRDHDTSASRDVAISRRGYYS